jgi:hypothetical protein
LWKILDIIRNKEKRPEGFRFSFDLRENMSPRRHGDAFGTVISDKVHFRNSPYAEGASRQPETVESHEKIRHVCWTL